MIIAFFGNLLSHSFIKMKYILSSLLHIPINSDLPIFCISSLLQGNYGFETLVCVIDIAHVSIMCSVSHETILQLFNIL